MTRYCTLSKKSSQTGARNICRLITIRIRMNKMVKGDEYLDYLSETLEWVAKPWSTLLGAFLKTKWRVLNSLKRPHRTGRGKTCNLQSHPSCDSSLSSSQRGARLKP